MQITNVGKVNLHLCNIIYIYLIYIISPSAPWLCSLVHIIYELAFKNNVYGYFRKNPIMYISLRQT